MNQLYDEYLKTLSDENKTRCEELVSVLKEAIPDIEFYRNTYYPIYYLDKKHYITIMFFKDYCNIHAVASYMFKDEIINKYFIHPKGMIKLKNNDLIDKDLFVKIFRESIKIEQ